MNWKVCRLTFAMTKPNLPRQLSQYPYKFPIVSVNRDLTLNGPNGCKSETVNSECFFPNTSLHLELVSVLGLLADPIVKMGRPHSGSLLYTYKPFNVRVHEKTLKIRLWSVESFWNNSKSHRNGSAWLISFPKPRRRSVDVQNRQKQMYTNIGIHWCKGNAFSEVKCRIQCQEKPSYTESDSCIETLHKPTTITSKTVSDQPASNRITLTSVKM